MYNIDWISRVNKENIIVTEVFKQRNLQYLSNKFYIQILNTIDRMKENTEEENIVFYLQIMFPQELSLKINTPFHYNNFYKVNHVHVLFLRKLNFHLHSKQTHTHTQLQSEEGKKAP